MQWTKKSNRPKTSIFTSNGHIRSLLVHGDGAVVKKTQVDIAQLVDIQRPTVAGMEKHGRDLKLSLFLMSIYRAH